MEKLKNIPTGIVVRTLLVNNEGKVLLTKRAIDTYDGGKWCLVGGLPDEGEELINAALREITEEVGVTLNSLSHYGEIENPDVSSGKRWITHYFLGNLDTLPNILQASEVSEVNFFSKNELQDVDIAFDHREVLIRFFDDS